MKTLVVALLVVGLVASSQVTRGDDTPSEQAVGGYRPALVLVEVTGLTDGTAQPLGEPRRGSGVVVRVRGDLVTVMTSARLVDLPTSTINVVFEAGTGAERRLAGTVTSIRTEVGVAFVDVAKMTNPPRPLAIPALALGVSKSRKDQPVFVLRHSPVGPKEAPVDLARGWAATEGPKPLEPSLLLRLDDPRNREFVGGLVIDGAGHALGLATKALATGPVDRYLPLDSIVSATEPRLEDYRFEARPLRGMRSATKERDTPSPVEFHARLDDPLGTTDSVGLFLTGKSALPKGPVRQINNTWEPILFGSRPTALTLIGNEVSGQFEVFEHAETEMSFWIQFLFLDSARGPRFGQPILYRFGQGIVADPVTTPVASVTAPPTAPMAVAPRVNPEPEPTGGFARSATASQKSKQLKGESAGATLPTKRGVQRPAKVEEPRGGFAELKGPSGSAKGREPVKTGTELGQDAKESDGLQYTEIDVPAGSILPCLTWSGNGTCFFLVEKTGLVRRIRADGFVEEAQLDIRSVCSWLSLSAEGLLVTIEGTGEVWVLDPETLKYRFKLAVPSVERVVGSPATGIAFGVGGTQSDAVLSVIDLKRRRIVKQYGPRDIPGGDDGFKHLAVTPDGKYLFWQGGIEQLQRYRIKGTSLDPQEASERIAQNGKSIVVSPDGYYVALPSGGGNYNGSKPYSTFIFKITDLKNPAITIQSGAYPTTLGFDLKAGLIYAQNTNFPFIVFTPTGVKQKESRLGGRAGNDTRQFLVYPEGGQVLVLTERRLVSVRVPKEEE